jgi:hypothetical protein
MLRRKNKWETLTEVQVDLDLEKCIKQLVLNAAKNVKFHSNPEKASQFTAENVIEKEEDSNSLI